MATLEGAIRLAAEAHEGQVDKSGEPYILHPLRVMLAQEGELARIVGVLHDVAEDAKHGWQDIHDMGFCPAILDAIDSVTRREGEDYFAYIERAQANPIGRVVKIADLKDNLDPRREPKHDPNRSKRMLKYEAAYALLTACKLREAA